MGWDAEDVALLKKLWAIGQSAAQIARRLRCTARGNLPCSAAVTTWRRRRSSILGRFVIEFVPIHEEYFWKGFPGSGLRLCEVQSNLCQIFLNRNRITKRHQVVTHLPHKRPEFLAFASRQGMNLSYDHLRIVQRVFGHSGEHGIHLADKIVVVLDLGMRVEDHTIQEIVPPRTTLLYQTQFDIQRLQLVIEPLREPFESKLRHIVEGAGRHRRQYAHERADVDEHATFVGAEVRQETANDVDGAAYI